MMMLYALFELSTRSANLCRRTMLSGSPLLCAYSQRPNMRNTAQVVLPVPERPSRMMELGGSGRSSMMRCSAGDTLNLKSTSLSFMPCGCTIKEQHLDERCLEDAAIMVVLATREAALCAQTGGMSRV